MKIKTVLKILVIFYLLFMMNACINLHVRANALNALRMSIFEYPEEVTVLFDDLRPSYLVYFLPRYKERDWFHNPLNYDILMQLKLEK